MKSGGHSYKSMSVALVSLAAAASRHKSPRDRLSRQGWPTWGGGGRWDRVPTSGCSLSVSNADDSGDGDERRLVKPERGKVVWNLRSTLSREHIFFFPRRMPKMKSHVRFHAVLRDSSSRCMDCSVTTKSNLHSNILEFWPCLVQLFGLQHDDKTYEVRLHIQQSLTSAHKRQSEVKKNTKMCK